MVLRGDISYEELKDIMLDAFGNSIKPKTIKLQRYVRYFDIDKAYIRDLRKIFYELKMKVNEYRVERLRNDYLEITYLVEYFDDDEKKKILYSEIESRIDFHKVLFNGTSKVTLEYNPKVNEVDVFKYYIFHEDDLQQVIEILEYLGQSNTSYNSIEIKENQYGISKLYSIQLHDKFPVDIVYPKPESVIGKFESIMRRANISNCGFTDRDGDISFFSHIIKNDSRVSNVGFRKDLGQVFLSTYEANVARILNFKNIEWDYEKKGFSLKSNTVKIVNDIEIDTISYFPDFFLNHNIIIEVKGFWDRHSIDKVSLFNQQILDYELYIIDSDMLLSLEKMYKNIIPNWEAMRIKSGVEILPIVGITRPERVVFVKNLKVGDEVILCRDSNNEYDKNAIKVLDKDNNLVGFISKEWALIFAPKMDVGMEFLSRIKTKESKVIYISVQRIDLKETTVYNFLLL
ncbi:HIRAN domain-containing protein [Paenibacillus sp. GYB006]|uniref:HIRAN domain-containing protein n=1 Tax=Paenibacillus sp. GYB006 TaxID=2994394 RepID=UPI002F965A62